MAVPELGHRRVSRVVTTTGAYCRIDTCPARADVPRAHPEPRAGQDPTQFKPVTRYDRLQQRRIDAAHLLAPRSAIVTVVVVVWPCRGGTAMPLTMPAHMHAIEYYRQHDRDWREHAYTEIVDDQGFVLVHDPAKREQWLVRYTRACAEDYFTRVRAEPGEWVVHVYRLLDGERRHLVSIRMHWTGL